MYTRIEKEIEMKGAFVGTSRQKELFCAGFQVTGISPVFISVL